MTLGILSFLSFLSLRNTEKSVMLISSKKKADRYSRATEYGIMDCICESGKEKGGRVYET